MVKKEFEKLQKKYSLPSWDDLSHEFELQGIDDDTFLLRELIKKMDDRLDFYLHLLERILSPDAGSMVDMYEARCFSEQDKRSFFELLRKLKFFRMLFYEAHLTRLEEKEAHAINDFFSSWMDLKKEILPIVTSLQSCWLKKDEKNESMEYLG